MSSNRWPFIGKVAEQHLTEGVWLREAAATYGSELEILRQKRVAAEFTKATGGRHPSQCVATDTWSESERQILRHYNSVGDLLEQDVHARLHFGSLIAFGAPGQPGADPVWIPTQTWFYLERDPSGQNIVRGDGIVYFYVRVVDQMVLLKREQEEPAAELAKPSRTGAPGRPNSSYLVKLEFDRRLETGELIQGSKLTIEVAEELAAWLQQAHPDVHPLTVKTIQNTLRGQWLTIPKRNAQD